MGDCALSAATSAGSGRSRARRALAKPGWRLRRRSVTVSREARADEIRCARPGSRVEPAAQGCNGGRRSLRARQTAMAAPVLHEQARLARTARASPDDEAARGWLADGAGSAAKAAPGRKAIAARPSGRTAPSTGLLTGRRPARPSPSRCPRQALAPERKRPGMAQQRREPPALALQQQRGCAARDRQHVERGRGGAPGGRDRRPCRDARPGARRALAQTQAAGCVKPCSADTRLGLTQAKPVSNVAHPLPP